MNNELQAGKIISSIDQISAINRLEIIDEGIRKKYLSRLTDLEIAPISKDQINYEDIFIDNVRLYKINEMVYQKGEIATDKFTTVFNTLSTYDASVFIIIDSNAKETDFYLGVRSNECADIKTKRSMVTLGETLSNTLVGNFPGVKIENQDRNKIVRISEKILRQSNVASVSVVGNKKINEFDNKQFIQGLEKLALAMYGKQYIGIIIAQNQSPKSIQLLRRSLQELYTNLSPLAKIQYTKGESESSTRAKSFFEMNGKEKANLISSAVLSMAGVGIGAALGSVPGAMIGGQIAGTFNNFINSLAPIEQITKVANESKTTTFENKTVIDLMSLIEDNLRKIDEYDSYGMWNVAGYFVSDDMSSAEIAASNYRSLMNGDKSGREVAAINSWRRNNEQLQGNFEDLTTSLSLYNHPQFIYGGDVNNKAIFIDASTSVSGKDLGLHLGLPRTTVPGLPVIEHAEFGKEVITCKIFDEEKKLKPEEKIIIGNIYDLGQKRNKEVELDNKSLNMHTFITGSTGSGKSNAVYQILIELHQEKIPFLVIEPAKGEYKDYFGNWEDVNVYSTNPNVAELININPFKFPKSIHVLEHIDGLVEIFSACWPMYDAMPAFFKDAILKSYEAIGWDLGSSTFDGDIVEFPDFEILSEQLSQLIENSAYASDIKSNYRGALLTRVKSLTIGLNKFIFTNNQTEYEKLFDENCILDISRVKSSETKALIMGLMVYILNEYRMDKKVINNDTLKHITVLEEAHNLLKNNSNSTNTDLINKSVEMITNTIAEIRTYGEGFIIVDQSPSSVDISAIKNTNTKIVLRTPEANDREAIGRSMGLNEEQVNEIAKLPSGVAVVYQNDWIMPVLTWINKANIEENQYKYSYEFVIKSKKEARTKIIKAIMQPWMNSEKIDFFELACSLNSLELIKENRKLLSVMICTYRDHGGCIIWDEKSLDLLKALLFDILNISVKEFNYILINKEEKSLKELVNSKIKGLNDDQITEICNILTIGEQNGY